MDALTQFELTITLLFQGLGEGLAPLMLIFTNLGHELFFMLVIPLVYWCVDAAAGLKIGAMLMITNGLNSVIKMAIHSPRPYWIDPRVRAFSSETSFGIPSGHSQTAAAVWGLAGKLTGRRWALWAAGLVVALIGLSRIYLGMHFVRDVLSGWLIGILLVAGFVRWQEPVSAWFRRLSLGGQLLAALFTALGLVAAGLLTRAALGDYTVPAAWAAAAEQAFPGNEITPLSLEAIFTVAGTWFGLMAGAALLLRWYGGLVPAGGPMLKRVLRFVLGVVVVFALYAGLGAVFPDEPLALGYGLRFVRYTLIGGWVTLGAPWTFVKLRLAEQRADKPV